MSFDSIHNYYEKRVIDYIERTLGRRIDDEEYLSDIACIALNHLPARYIRFEVDMIFFLTPQEQKKMELEISRAVQNAVKMVEQRDQEISHATKTKQGRGK